MKKVMALGALLALLPTPAFALRWHVTAGGRVPHQGDQTISTDWTVFTFTVAGEQPILIDVNLNLDMVHSWDEDLEIWLYAPTGAGVRLFNRLPGGPPRFDDFDDTYFDDQAANPITGGKAPYAGSFRPQQALAAFNGIDPNGVWQLRLWDHNYGDYGYVYRFNDPPFEEAEGMGWRGHLSGTFIDIVSIPEPALGSLAFLGLLALRRMRLKR